jgi:small-conductance mechanosensitive channel
MSEATILLTTSSALIVAAVFVPHGFPRWLLWVRVSWNLAALVLLTALLYHVIGSPLRPNFQNAKLDEQLWAQLIEASWWVLAARVAVGLARVFVVMEGRPRETQIISDLMAGAIYVATSLAVVAFAFSVPIASLLATSGVIAIVLGLALQSTLSDVFSGIAVGIERPYKAGDLIWVEGGIEGRVTQVTWRSTHVSTGDKNIAIVPNSVVAKARIINQSLPSEVRGDTLELRLDPTVRVGDCLLTLTAAVRSCRLPFASPDAEIVCTGLLGDGAIYEIVFFVASSKTLSAVRSELFSEVQRHLKHAGIGVAVSGQSTIPYVPVPSPADLLSQSDLFCILGKEERESLASRMETVTFEINYLIIKQDDAPEAMFIVAAGALEITVAAIEGSLIVHRMGPGESLGAIGLISGQPYAATATALTRVQVLKLSKVAVNAAIEEQPGLQAKLTLVAERGLAGLPEDPLAPEDLSGVQSGMLMRRVHAFLHKFA